MPDLEGTKNTPLGALDYKLSKIITSTEMEKWGLPFLSPDDLTVKLSPSTLTIKATHMNLALPDFNWQYQLQGVGNSIEDGVGTMLIKDITFELVFEIKLLNFDIPSITLGSFNIQVGSFDFQVSVGNSVRLGQQSYTYSTG